MIGGPALAALLSSHLLAGAAQTVDDVVVIDRGGLAHEGPISQTVPGAALGALIRVPVVGAVVLLMLDLAVQPLVSGAWEREANLSPFGAAGVMTGGTRTTTKRWRSAPPPANVNSSM
ncbi:hypothetical protein [Actinomadura physcomitrii]|uniref:hypothetical protein n=1 Tax=Actinomadura physcomitrii TaxID=2650748 RepID=UPI00192251FB|nr:hypothetical protein [Actinomadura physcomitrii]